MNKAILVLVILAIIAITATNAYKLKPSHVRLVGKGAGHHFWKPTRAVKFADALGAFRISTAEDDCDEKGTCKFATAFTADGGDSWKVEKDNDLADFCGSAGVVEEGKVRCVGEQVDKDGDDTRITFEQYEYEIIPAGIVSSAKMVKVKHEKQVTVAHPDFEPTAVKFGDYTVAVPEKETHLRNAEVTLPNGTVIHAFLNSADGHHWDFVSEVPFPFGEESTLQRIGETKVILLSGEPGNYTQAQSIYLGRRWEKVETMSLPTPLSSYVSPYYTSIYGGIRGRPGIYAMAVGSGGSKKKNNEKPINLVNFHNRLMAKDDAPTDVLNFTEEYVQSMNTTAEGFVANFTCHEQPHSTEHSDGCHSSSYANVLQLANDTVVMLYDQLFNGWNAGTLESPSNVYAMKLNLDESKELKEAEERVAEAERKKKREEEYEASRKQAQKDKQERERKARREKLRKNKARRAEFQEADLPNVELAKISQEEDGEYVVVREVDMDYLDIEKDIF